MKLLYKGISGSEVKDWQQFLISMNYSLPKYGADKVFGNETVTATKKYQAAKKLKADGIVGRLTIEAAMDDGFKTVKVFTREINDIVCHITATAKLPINYKWYHDVVMPDGEIKHGRDYDIISASVHGYNQHIIGSSYVSRGNDFDSNGKYGKYFVTKEQKESYEKLFAYYLITFKRDLKTDLWGHNDFNAGKACPCFKVQQSPEFLEAVAHHIKNGVDIQIIQ